MARLAERICVNLANGALMVLSIAAQKTIKNPRPDCQICFQTMLQLVLMYK